MRKQLCLGKDLARHLYDKHVQRVRKALTEKRRRCRLLPQCELDAMTEEERGIVDDQKLKREAREKLPEILSADVLA